MYLHLYVNSNYIIYVHEEREKKVIKNKYILNYSFRIPSSATFFLSTNHQLQQYYNIIYKNSMLYTYISDE